MTAVLAYTFWPLLAILALVYVVTAVHRPERAR